MASPIDGITLRSVSVLGEAMQRRENAEKVMAAVVLRKVAPEPPKRGPAICAEDVLDDLKMAAVERNGQLSKVLAKNG